MKSRLHWLAWGGLVCLLVLSSTDAATQKTVPPKKLAASKAQLKSVKKTAKKATSTKTVKASGTSMPDPAQAEALEQERSALKEKLAQLKRDIAASESSRSEVADQLAVSERAISDVNRKLRTLDSQQGRVQTQLLDLNQRQGTTQSQIDQQQAQLSRLLRQQYVAGDIQDPFRLLFSGDDPNRVQRDRAYLGYLAESEADVLRKLRGNFDQLKKLGDETQSRNRALASIAEEQQSSRAALVKEQAAKQATLAGISTRLQAQRREAGALERDEQRLGKVVEEIARVLARQAQENKEREKKLREQAQQRERERLAELQHLKSDTKPGTASGTRETVPEKPVVSSGLSSGSSASKVPESGPQNVLTPQAGFVGNLAALKGQLRLPVRGEVTSRFGKTRVDGGPSWKGLFIRASEGADVKAIAAGRVVFAEWLRGFGNLLIVDHGSQYLSIYGNNESLLKQAGDTVQSGDVVASVGNSGGNPESGLYFEMRFQGKPFDPLNWARLR